MSVLDKYVPEKSRQRKREKNGRTIGLVLRDGKRIIGELINHETNKLRIKDWRDNDLEKDIHRALVIRFLLVIEGGKDE